MTNEEDFWVLHAKWCLRRVSDEEYADFLEERYKDDPPSPVVDILLEELRSNDKES